MSTNWTAGDGASWPRKWATSMVLPNPASPATTMPETSARRIMTGRESSAQPSHQAVRLAGAMPDRSTRAGASSGSRRSPAAGSAQVVDHDLGRREAVLTGPLIPIAQPEGLGEQRPLSRQPSGLAGPLPDGSLRRMHMGLASPQPPAEQAADQGGGAADHRQQQRQPDEGGKHQPIPPLAGPQGSAAAGDQQPVTATLHELAVAVIGQIGRTAAAVPAV